MIPVALVMLLTSVPPVGVGHGADPEGRCKFLRGDSAGSYSCGLVDDGTVSKDTIHAGAGFCSPLGNTARDNVLKILQNNARG